VASKTWFWGDDFSRLFLEGLPDQKLDIEVVTSCTISGQFLVGYPYLGNILAPLMNPFFKLFIVQQPDGRQKLSYRAFGYLFLALCVLTLFIDFFVTHGPLFPPHR
jgi:hypothetical protein